MMKISFTAFVIGLALSFMVISGVMAQSPTEVVPTTAPATGRG